MLSRKSRQRFALFFGLLLLLSMPCCIISDSTDDDTTTNNDGAPTNTSNPRSEHPRLIAIGETYEISKLIASNGEYQAAGFFEVVIDTPIPDQDLVIMVTGREDYSHTPALMYSLTNEYPEMTGSNNINCGITGHDFCVIPDTFLSANQKIYIGVFCFNSCKFSISAQYNTQHVQALNQSVRYDLNNKDEQLLEVTIVIPDDFDSEIERIIIESYILNYYNAQSHYHMYVNLGPVFPTPTQYDFVTETMKLNGQSVLMNRFEDGITAGSKISVSIEVPALAQILLRSEAFPMERTIHFFREIDDMVGGNEIRFFKLEITQYTYAQWDQAEISIDLEPYFGNPDLYVVRGALPQDPTDLNSYTWRSAELSGLESLTITKHSIGINSFIGEVFYIAVFGESAATFSLMAYSSSLAERELNFDSVENGYAVANDIIAYQFRIEDVEESDITVSLQNIQGASKLFIRKCIGIVKITECEITEEIITKYRTSPPDDSFWRSEEQSMVHKLTFHYKLNDCIDEATFLNTCTYVVAVQGASKNASAYRLTAKHSKNSFLMKEGDEYRFYLLENELEYFVFPITVDDNSISKVEFIVQAITGDIEVYSSRTIPFPTVSDSDFAEFATEDTISYSRKRDGSQEDVALKGNFYIAVRALSGCIFTIHTKVYRVTGTGDNPNSVTSTAKEINFGNVENGYLTYDQPHQFYFKVPASERSPTHETTISLYYSAFKDHKEQNVDIEPKIAIHYHFNQTIYPVEKAEDDFTSANFIYIKLKSSFLNCGRYVITLQHKDQKQQDYKISYSLNVNAENVVYIVPKISYISDLQVGKRDMYEMYLNGAQQVYLEIFECFGQVKVQAANSLESIESSNFDVKTNTPPRYIGDHLIVTYERQQKGPLYISFSTLVGIPVRSKEKALYMIIPHVLPSKQVKPHEVYSTPSEGSILGEGEFLVNAQTQSVDSTFKVSFNPIECANGCEDSIYIATQYEYIVHVTNEMNLMQYYSKCDLHTYQLQYLGFNSTGIIHERSSIVVDGAKQNTNYTVSFENLRNGTYYVEIMGIVYFETTHNAKISEPFTFIYPMKQFVLGTQGGALQDQNETEIIKSHRKGEPIIPIWLMIPLGLALLVLIIVCIVKQVKTFLIRRRYRIAMEAQENQEVEIQDNKGNDINDDDERQKGRKTDQLNLFNKE